MVGIPMQNQSGLKRVVLGVALLALLVDGIRHVIETRRARRAASRAER